MRTMGELIRQRRKRLGLTAAQLAKKAMCSKSYISKLETGQRRPSLPTLLRLCSALACSTLDILTTEANNGSIGDDKGN